MTCASPAERIVRPSYRRLVGRYDVGDDARPDLAFKALVRDESIDRNGENGVGAGLTRERSSNLRMRAHRPREGPWIGQPGRQGHYRESGDPPDVRRERVGYRVQH